MYQIIVTVSQPVELTYNTIFFYWVGSFLVHHKLGADGEMVERMYLTRKVNLLVNPVTVQRSDEIIFGLSGGYYVILSLHNDNVGFVAL